MWGHLAPAEKTEVTLPDDGKPWGALMTLQTELPGSGSIRHQTVVRTKPRGQIPAWRYRQEALYHWLLATKPQLSEGSEVQDSLPWPRHSSPTYLFFLLIEVVNYDPNKEIQRKEATKDDEDDEV